MTEVVDGFAARVAGQFRKTLVKGLSLNEFVKEAFSVESFANADFENEATVFLWVG